MKNRIRWGLLSLCLFLWNTSLMGQQINFAEYFFDTDPGFGNANSISFTPDSMLTLNLNLDVQSLSNGLHNLYIRMQDDSMRRSLLSAATFLKLAGDHTTANFNRIEYFLDEDPGLGNGVEVPFTGGMFIDEAFTVDLDTVTNGLHILYVRARDNLGRWSLLQSFSFLKVDAEDSNASFSRLEYFFDTDPGLGNVTSISFDPGNALDISVNLDLSSLEAGLHTLYVRAQDNFGRWSLLQSGSFITVPGGGNDLFTQLEYFIDNDPGLGNGISVSIPETSDTLDLSFEVDLSSVENGFHYLYVRAQNDAGQWSLLNTAPFYKRAGLTVPPTYQALEYFIDTDPGFGNGISLQISNEATIDLLVNLDLTGLADGAHNLYVRGRDSWGNWSLLNKYPFFQGQELFQEIVLNDQIEPEVANYYRWDVPDSLAGKSAVITIEAVDEQAVLEWYMAIDTIPVRGGTPFHYNFGPDQAEYGFFMDDLSEASYYFLLYVDQLADPNVNILVHILDFELLEFTPASGGRSGPITVELLGGEFAEDMTFSLAQGGNSTLSSQSLEIISPSRAFATFNLVEIPEGVYDLELQRPTFSTITVVDTFTVTQGELIPGYNTNPNADGCSPGLSEDGSVLFVSIENPRVTRFNSIVPLTIHFENRGTIDIPTPTRIFLSETGLPLSFSAEETRTSEQSELLLTFIEENGPTDVLRAGARGSITVYAFFNNRGENGFKLLR